MRPAVESGPHVYRNGFDMKTLPEPTTNVQPPALPITVEHAARWQKLLITAQERRLKLVSSFADWISADHCRATFVISSYSQPNMTHTVVVENDARDQITTRCDCFAGSVPIGCTHAALAVESTGWWPFPIHAQTDMEISDGSDVDQEQPLQPARYAVGQAVKLVWQQRRTFWVHSLSFDGTGWRYQLADEARRVVLEADEHKLRPATSKRSVAA